MLRASIINIRFFDGNTGFVKKRNIKTLVILLALSWNCLYGQNMEDIYREIGIKRIDEIFYSPPNKKIQTDSLLVKVVFLDTLGRIKELNKWNASKRLNVYFYSYEGERLKKIRTQTSKGIRLVSRFNYTKKGQLKSKNKYNLGSLSRKERYRYDYKNRLREKVIRSYIYTYKEKTVYLYNNLGQQVKEVSSKRKKPEFDFTYDEQGNINVIYRTDRKKRKSIYIERKYDNENQVVEEQTHCYNKFILPDVLLKTVANKGDIWVKKYTYNQLGLIIEVTSWLNNELVGIKKITYTI